MPSFHEQFSKLTENMTQTEVGQALNISQPTVSGFRSGKICPRVDSLILIAEHYHCSTDWLLGLTKVQTSNAETRAVCDYLSLPENVIQNLVQASLGGTNTMLASLLGAEDFYLLVSALSAAKNSNDITDPDSIYFQRRYIAFRLFERLADALTKPEEEKEHGKR